MFRIYSKGDVVREGNAFNTTNYFNNIEALYDSDFVVAADLNRATENLYANQAELFEYINNFVNSNISLHSIIPNSKIYGNDTSFKIDDSNIKLYNILTPDSSTIQKYIVSIPFGVASTSNGIVVHKIIPTILERQIANAIGITNLELEGVIIKVQDNAGTGDFDKIMCQVKVINPINELEVNTIYYGCTESNWNLNNYTDAYINTMELINAINSTTTPNNFQGKLLEKVKDGSNYHLEWYRGQQLIDILPDTDYRIFINQTTGLCDVELTSVTKSRFNIYLAEFNINGLTGVVTLTDLRSKLILSPLGFNQMPPIEPNIYLDGEFDINNNIINEGIDEIAFIRNNVSNNSSNLFLNGKKKFSFDSTNATITNYDAFNYGGSSVIVSFYLYLSVIGSSSEQICSFNGTTINVDYEDGHATISSNSEEIEIFVNGIKDYQPFNALETISVLFKIELSELTDVGDLVFGSATNAPNGSFIGEIRIYEGLEFNTNYVNGLSLLASSFINRKNANFENLIVEDLVAGEIEINENLYSRGEKNNVNISYVPSNDAIPLFKIDEGFVHVRDSNLGDERDITYKVDYDSTLSINDNIYTSNTTRPADAGQITGKTWTDIACSWDGKVVVACATSDYVYISIDGGQTWKRTASIQANWISLAINYDGSVIYAAHNDSAGKVYKSTDHGASWTLLFPQLTTIIRRVACGIDGNNVIVAGTNEGFSLSTDGGTNFTKKTSSGANTWCGVSVYESPEYTYFYAVHATSTSIFYYTSQDSYTAFNEISTGVGSVLWQGLSARNNNIYVVGTNYIRGFSIDSGLSILEITNTTPYVDVTSCARPHFEEVVFACSSGASGNILNITNGSNFVLSTTNNHDWVKVECDQTGNRVFAITANDIYYSNNKETWYKATFDETNSVGIACSKDGEYAANAIYGGYIYTLEKGNINWVERKGSGARNWTGITCSSDGSIIAACVDSGLIYRSTDYGKTWTSADSARAWTGISSDLSGTNMAACVTGGTVYLSSDKGVTWSSSGPTFNWNCIASNNDGTILLAGSEEGIVAIYNGGWASTNLPSAINSVSVSYDGTKFYACTATNVYKKDGVGVWTDMQAGSYTFTNIKCSSNGKYVIVAHTTGIIKSSDYGETWVEVESGATSSTRYIDISFDSNIIFEEENGSLSGKKYFRYNTNYVFDSTTTNFPSPGAWAFVVIDSKDNYSIKLQEALGDGSKRPEEDFGRIFFKELQFDGYYYLDYTDGKKIIGAIYNKGITHNNWSPERANDFYIINLGNRDTESGKTNKGLYTLKDDGIAECTIFAQELSGKNLSPSLVGGGLYKFTVSYDFPIRFLTVDDLIIITEENFATISHIVYKTTTSVTISYETANSDTLFDLKIKVIGRWK